MTTVFNVCELPADAVEMGRLGEAWGIKGWLKVHAYSASPDALMDADEWFLQRPLAPHDRGFVAFNGTVSVKPLAVKPHADTLVVQLDGVNDRNASEALKGARIYVARSHFPACSDPDEYYWVDLLGLHVVNREGVLLGQVKDLMATGPTSVLVLSHEQDGKPAERLIPFVSAYVDNVDKAAGRITVDWQPDY